MSASIEQELYEEWASDGSFFVFMNPILNPPKWFKVDINTRQITESLDYPLAPDLSAEELQIFQTEDVIRTSPDGQLFLYTVRGIENTNIIEGDPRSFWYTVANRNTQQIVVTLISAANEENIGDFTAIQWSSDSSSVAIRALTEGGTPLCHNR